MENIKKNLDGQLYLFNKDNWMKPVEDIIDDKLDEQDILFHSIFEEPLDEMDRKSDSYLFGNKPL